ncbi:unnamed protein product [Acanthoscelides obtectus]|uniref:Mos1 transposase HTH domain-containing protein n=1 Tax=Acanthoscelides obtectus TaxID=200917 RepID=A0A9P0LE65_ACAOB|nr:unnamed protein product [Acanthoscelides obtectus]CAK1633638.1 hypothetical protein AOBTE_LOCUS8277 [Acanthoscelides obtectus]
MTLALKDDGPHRMTIFRWYREFQRGNFTVEDAERKGRSRTYRTETCDNEQVVIEGHPSISRFKKFKGKIMETYLAIGRSNLLRLVDKTQVNNFNVAFAKYKVGMKSSDILGPKHTIALPPRLKPFYFSLLAPNQWYLVTASLPYCFVLTGIGGVVAPSPLCDLAANHTLTCFTCGDKHWCTWWPPTNIIDSDNIHLILSVWTQVPDRIVHVPDTEG